MNILFWKIFLWEIRRNFCRIFCTYDPLKKLLLQKFLGMYCFRYSECLENIPVINFLIFVEYTCQFHWNRNVNSSEFYGLFKLGVYDNSESNYLQKFTTLDIGYLTQSIKINTKYVFDVERSDGFSSVYDLTFKFERL